MNFKENKRVDVQTGRRTDGKAGDGTLRTSSAFFLCIYANMRERIKTATGKSLLKKLEKDVNKFILKCTVNF